MYPLLLKKSLIDFCCIVLGFQLFSCSYCRMIQPDDCKQYNSKKNIILKIYTSEGKFIKARKFIARNNALFVFLESTLYREAKTITLPSDQIQSITA